MRHSQNQEEDIIISYFGEKIGTFLDIGANDGKTLSNTHAICLKGWKGTLVEPSPAAMERLVELYKGNENVELLQVGVSNYDGKGILRQSGSLLNTGDIALVSSLDEEDEVHRWDGTGIPFEDVEIEVVNFKTLLSMSKLQKFTLISIDIENKERIVVPQINFEELECEMAIIEWNLKMGEFYDKIMLEHGMGVIHVNAENRIYVQIGGR